MTDIDDAILMLELLVDCLAESPENQKLQKLVTKQQETIEWKKFLQSRKAQKLLNQMKGNKPPGDLTDKDYDLIGRSLATIYKSTKEKKDNDSNK